MYERYDQAADLFCCPACGQRVDCCQGHGMMGDPAGWAALRKHDAGCHRDCHPDGCEATGQPIPAQREQS